MRHNAVKWASGLALESITKDMPWLVIDAQEREKRFALQMEVLLAILPYAHVDYANEFKESPLDYMLVENNELTTKTEEQLAKIRKSEAVMKFASALKAYKYNPRRQLSLMCLAARTVMKHLVIHKPNGSEPIIPKVLEEFLNKH